MDSMHDLTILVPSLNRCYNISRWIYPTSWDVRGNWWLVDDLFGGYATEYSVDYPESLVFLLILIKIGEREKERYPKMEDKTT